MNLLNNLLDNDRSSDVLLDPMGLFLPVASCLISGKLDIMFFVISSTIPGKSFFSFSSIASDKLFSSLVGWMFVSDDFAPLLEIRVTW